MLVTSTPAMIWVSTSVANCTLNAGLNPPSAIFITRANGSLTIWPSGTTEPIWYAIVPATGQSLKVFRRTLTGAPPRSERKVVFEGTLGGN